MGMNLKKMFLTLLCVGMVFSAAAQVQITTRKAKIGDFTQKILKVVLPGQPLDKAAFEQEISSGWRISPYEFCTAEVCNVRFLSEQQAEEYGDEENSGEEYSIPEPTFSI